MPPKKSKGPKPKPMVLSEDEKKAIENKFNSIINRDNNKLR